jgi:hypothetical protein
MCGEAFLFELPDAKRNKEGMIPNVSVYFSDASESVTTTMLSFKCIFGKLGMLPVMATSTMFLSQRT